MSEKKKVSKQPVKKRYSSEDLNAPITIIREKKMSANKASQRFNIPKGTLIHKLHDNVPSDCKMGPSTVLSPQEELCIKNWIIDKAKLGFPMHPEDVKDAVQKILTDVKRPNPFLNNRPGRKWFSLFLQRHPDVVLKNTETLSKARASVTEENILDWFNGLQNYAAEEGVEDIFKDPKRIINLDELGMSTCPKTGKLLGPKGEKNFYQVATGPEKQSISVLCTFSADELIENNIPLELINSFKEAVNLNQDPSDEKLLFTIWRKLITSLELNDNTRINPVLEHELENDPNSLLLSTSFSQEILNQLSPELTENSELTVKSDSLNLTTALDDTVPLDSSFSCFDIVNLENTVIIPESRLSDSRVPETSSFKSPSGNLATTVILESNNNDTNCKSREELNKADHNEVWKKHLHFPQINKTDKKKHKQKRRFLQLLLKDITS
ncbi:Protein of unknown function [Cotesia congregata]|uniref:HTH CENPB-type domain-containing protein n=1 Tax=Cotesia congregata TaxID=51543 RepID=A0A8J2EFC9_COTCN|nr:Protein of unknown function [Cotesia congregata]